MQEIYKDIKGYEGQYQISNLGNVRRLEHRVKVGKYTRLLRPMQMKTVKNKGGYLHIVLHGETKLVHRLVAETFLYKDVDGMVVNHKDYDRSNNSVDNLEWVTVRENLSHSREHLMNSIKPLLTGERNISMRKREKKPYHLSIKRNGKAIQKSFKTLEEAVKERDRLLLIVGEPWQA